MYRAEAQMDASALGLGVRWGTVYFSDATGLLTVLTRNALPADQIRFGLRAYVAARSLGELLRLVAEEDEKYRRYLAEKGERNDHAG